jgi:perosamine synthetase
MTAARLAIDGGSPVRDGLLPYGRQTVTDRDIAAVTDALRSDFLTTGPRVAKFEDALASVAGTRHAVAVSSGTAALHTMLAAAGVGPGDEVIVPVITFAATANAALYLGAKPVFADLDPDTLLIDPRSVERCITPRTRAIVAVDYAGQPADYEALAAVAGEVPVYADACHALGGSLNGKPVGALTEMSSFSFHPVKHVAAGEGGAITTDDDDLAEAMRSFRNHGITTDHARRTAAGTWTYDMEDLGFNYRLSDIHCALATSQLERLSANVTRRQEIAARYDAGFRELSGVTPLVTRDGVSNAHHIYVVLLGSSQFKSGRSEFFSALRAENIGVNVHYIPVPWHPYYRKLGYERGGWPTGEDAYERMMTLPIWPGMTDGDADDVIEAVRKVTSVYQR